jgi:sporulation protein YlmC with PRC-barrel domain
MRVTKAKMTFVAMILFIASAHAQSPGRIDLDVASTLIGSPVIAADGQSVGQVSDIAMDEDGRAEAIRVSVGTRLGLGARTIELPKWLFSIQDGRVVLSIGPEAVDAIPERTDVREEK